LFWGKRGERLKLILDVSFQHLMLSLLSHATGVPAPEIEAIAKKTSPLLVVPWQINQPFHWPRNSPSPCLVSASRFFQGKRGERPRLILNGSFQHLMLSLLSHATGVPAPEIEAIAKKISPLLVVPWQINQPFHWPHNSPSPCLVSASRLFWGKRGERLKLILDVSFQHLMLSLLSHATGVPAPEIWAIAKKISPLLVVARQINQPRYWPPNSPSPA